MKSFQYQLLRFLPDRITGEFVNLGVVAYDPDEKRIGVRLIDKTTRLSQVFPNTNSRFIIKTVRFIEEQLKKLDNQLSSELEFESFVSLEEVTRRVLPKDDSALFFTETTLSLDVSINALVDYLYNRQVNINLTESDREYQSDKDIWSKIYKEYFDQLNISRYLKPVSIKTKFEEVRFEHSWKNGHLNFFETVNFDLQKTESIRNKVFRWAGQIDELKTSKEPSHLYLLALLPKDDISTNNFIKEFLQSKSSSKVTVEVIVPENARRVALDIKNEIDAHASTH